MKVYWASTAFGTTVITNDYHKSHSCLKPTKIESTIWNIVYRQGEIWKCFRSIKDANLIFLSGIVQNEIQWLTINNIARLKIVTAKSSYQLTVCLSNKNFMGANRRNVFPKQYNFPASYLFQGGDILESIMCILGTFLKVSIFRAFARQFHDLNLSWHIDMCINVKVDNDGDACQLSNWKIIQNSGRVSFSFWNQLGLQSTTSWNLV